MAYETKRTVFPLSARSTAERVRAIALNMFVDQGFERVSVRDLAAAINLHAGSLYNHIESKQSLLFDLIEEHEAGLLATISNCRGCRRAPSAMLSDYIDAYVRFQLNNPKTAALARLELRSLSNDQRSLIADIRSHYQRQLVDIISRFNKPNDANNLVASIVVPCVTEMLNGLASAVPNSPEVYSARRSIERIQTLLAEALTRYSPEQAPQNSHTAHPKGANTWMRR
ncbi:TetR/AcrR family transcriptional regulator [Stutzerimonas chloritidismutans]|uniref:TetR/AcrR family transcriptional regulator n=1 Tax=Stutzerimonas chloritidismutans TaxID=203192 RepID=UPI003F13EED5